MGREKGLLIVVLVVSLTGLVPGTRAQEEEGQRRRPGGVSGGERPARPDRTAGEARPDETSETTETTAVNSSNSNAGSIALLRTDVTRDDSGSEVAVNWENITLKDCIEVLCRDLGMEFIISPSVNVTQEVSIRAGNVTKWERADKLEMFDAILDTAGVQRISRGRVWVFSPSDLRPIVKSSEESEYSDGKPIIGVIELLNIDASTAQEFLNNFSGKPQRIFGMTSSNILIVIGTHAYLQQMQDLLNIVDVPSSVLVQHVLKTADASDIAGELSNVFYRRTGNDGSAVQFFAIARLNMVVAHNATPAMVPEIERWIAMLDRSDGQNARTTKIYRLKVVEAETIGNTLDELYSSLYAQSVEREKELGKTSSKSSTAKDSTSKKTTSNTTGKTAAQSKTPATSTTQNSSGGEVAGTSVDEEVIILSDEDTNTLIVNAPADMHKEIAKTIEDLDRSRRQVLIETALVEVTLDESTQLGVEWAILGQGNPSHSGAQMADLSLSEITAVDGSIMAATDGLTYLFNKSDEALALIHAAQDEDRLQVLSSPTVLTRDGMEAEISFGEEVPIQQSSITDGGNQNFSYDYRDAKITLKVTPKIDEFGMVTLDLEQTLRSINPETIDDEAPKFYTRELRSNLQVDDGQTLVLGGLIQRSDQKVRTGIPFLSQIPYVGWLFGSTKTVKVGSEILMILTPHVVSTREETDLLTEEFEHKILGALSEKNIRTLYGLDKKSLDEPVPEEGAPKEEK